MAYYKTAAGLQTCDCSLPVMLVTDLYLYNLTINSFKLSLPTLKILSHFRCNNLLRYSVTSLGLFCQNKNPLYLFVYCLQILFMFKIRNLIMAFIFFLLPVSKRNHMSVGRFQKPSKNSIDRIESIIGNAHSKGFRKFGFFRRRRGRLLSFFFYNRFGRWRF